MHILVTGGSGVVGEAAVRALLARGHHVRLLARHAEDDAAEWPAASHGTGTVEAWPGDVTKPDTLRGAGDGCDAVLHVVGIVDEAPPHVTFQSVNVDGTRHVVEEATRAGVPHLVYVSSLGADRGASDYHRSKLAGEHEAMRFGGRWVIVRPGNVYGPGDAVVSLLLRMVRTLPAIPVVAGGDQPFQPVWADDVGACLALACERADLAGRALDVAGTDRTSMNDLLDRFGALTDRKPIRLPLPGILARLGLAAADAIGVDMPINDGQLTMLAEGNVIERDADNALVAVFGVAPTPLDAGLRRLLDALPEQLPEDGVGALHRKRFWAEIDGATIDLPTLFDRFCRRFQQVTPDQMDLAAEPGSPTAVLARGQTVTMALPLRGNVQVRVAERSEERRACALTLQTVEGHVLAGAVRFTLDTGRSPEALGDAPPPVDDAPDAGDDAAAARGPLRFQIELFDRAANVADWVAMTVLGERLQDATWREIVEAVVEESGGRAPAGVQEARDTLEGEEATRIERWMADLATAAKRERNARQLADAAPTPGDRGDAGPRGAAPPPASGEGPRPER